MNDDSLFFRDSDQYWDATALCRQSGKLVHNYLRTRRTKVVIECLSRRLGIPSDELVKVDFAPGSNRYTHTWVHFMVFIDLAHWLKTDTSMKYLLEVFDRVGLWHKLTEYDRTRNRYYLED